MAASTDKTIADESFRGGEVEFIVDSEEDDDDAGAGAQPKAITELINTMAKPKKGAPSNQYNVQ